MIEQAKVTVYKRERADVTGGEYQADIISISIAGGGGDHHGIGRTPAEALMNAALHWYRGEATFIARKQGADEMESRYRYPDLSGS